MRRAFALLIAGCGLVLTSGAGARAATPRPRPHVTPHVDPAYAAFLERRDDRLGAWLPRVDDLVEPSKRHLSKLGPREDALLPLLHAASPLTRFWYSAPGPPSIWAQYDARHRIVRYTNDCCGHEEEVVASGIGPPPHPVAAEDLRGVRTLHGARLGMTQTQIQALYGRVQPHRSTSGTPYDVLSYAHAVKGRPNCGEVQNFGLRAGRVVAIQIGRSC